MNKNCHASIIIFTRKFLKHLDAYGCIKLFLLKKNALFISFGPMHGHETIVCWVQFLS